MASLIRPVREGVVRPKGLYGLLGLAPSLQCLSIGSRAAQIKKKLSARMNFPQLTAVEGELMHPSLYGCCKNQKRPTIGQMLLASSPSFSAHCIHTVWHLLLLSLLLLFLFMRADACCLVKRGALTILFMRPVAIAIRPDQAFRVSSR